ncbi:alanine/glycine:cation symporter family protein [Kistimonas asteriae]|uniref:alanine/glycine:cation symporter family protein n=1 Tax=Kistimonas asteriae TaxID=517724 RepID=UPI001BAA9451|nr:sodium:alanine symporter family protein [Kistimonas asteriae]
MTGLINSFNAILWGYGLVYLLMGAGIYFSLRSGLVQVRHFPLTLRLLLQSKRTSDSRNISSFQALCTSLASHVGTSNLAGVAIAVYMGGPGAVFWMWVIAILGMATSFVENTLAQVYKSNNKDGTFRGGPAYYIEKALGQRNLAIAFSVCMVLSFGFSFNAVHSNSVATALSHAFALPELSVGLVLALMTALIIFRGLRGIARFAEQTVPFMATAYLLTAGMVMFLYHDRLIDVFRLVIDSAFGLQTAAAGGMGYMVSQAMLQGIRRGLFSNEAGMGSSPNINAVAAPTPNHPATQGLISMFSVFTDTILICTATAMIVLLSGEYLNGDGVTGIALTQNALSSAVGAWGKPFIAFITMLFGFTSIVANAYYGESSLRHIKDNRRLILWYRCIVIMMVFWGSFSSLPVVWSLADLTMGVMALINLVVIVLLSGTAFALLKDFEQQYHSGIEEPVFNRKQFPELDKAMDQDVWPVPENNPCDQAPNNDDDDPMMQEFDDMEKL